jgi:glycosyltransferase involved in cell wall biosynthesis
VIARSRAERVGLIAQTLELDRGARTDAELAAALTTPDASAAYLVLSVLRGRIPEPDEVVNAVRTWRTDGAAALLALAGRARDTHGVRVSSALVVDVHDTSRQPFTTGIQRVVRSTLASWPVPDELDLVAWTPDFAAPRTLSASERNLALGDVSAVASPPARSEVVVPFRGAVAVLEIATDRRRATRLRTIAEFSGSRSLAVGHDCIPITSAETTGAGMPGAFSRYLAALAEFDVVATTSTSSDAEYSGWRAMLSGSGVVGPEVVEVGLPSAASDVTGADADRVREEFGLGDLPVVLAVGSHEPRKNHLALLHAAEVVWRAGGRFTLVMVGGNSWNAAGFRRVVEERRADGRPLVTVAGASDATIDALYRLARFTVFPSLNEGFGLPIVESIARGTPVITSDYGSMRELAEGYGGLLVDGRDDAALATAIAGLLSDDAQLTRLRDQTRLLPDRDWPQYAADLRRLVYSPEGRISSG